MVVICLINVYVYGETALYQSYMIHSEIKFAQLMAANSYCLMYIFVFVLVIMLHVDMLDDFKLE